MKINSVLNGLNMGKTQGTSPQIQPQGQSFAQVLEKAIGEVNTEQLQAYDSMQGIATGKVENLQKAVQQIEEAELSLKLALETKNKAISAYKQITQMQI